MEITLFNAITTEDVIAELEEDSTKYDGLYVDMNNAPERKYVKGKAELINDIRKNLNRARIDLAKSYKASIEAEFKLIDERLDNANKPFTLLIDEHKAERAKILADEKAAAQAIVDAEQLEYDHEFALLMNQTWEQDQAELVRKQKEHDEAIAKQAAIDAENRLTRLAEAQERDRINEENARLANREHVASVNRGILEVLTEHGLSEDQAKLVIRLAVHKKLPQLTINY